MNDNDRVPATITSNANAETSLQDAATEQYRWRLAP